VLAGKFDEKRNPNGGDEYGELWPLAQRAVSQEFDQHSDDRANPCCDHDY
jgi:hypothetical protein